MLLDQTHNKIQVRNADEDDRAQLASLIHFEKHVHRHLDWRPPLDWLGFDPYMVLEKNGRVAAVMACPPDPPGVAWLRVFACGPKTNPTNAWEQLWPEVYAQFKDMPGISIAAIPLQQWFCDLLVTQGFKHEHDVVALVWESMDERGQPEVNCSSTIRPMTADDLEHIQDIDMAAFGPIWRNSLDSLQLAFDQAAVATVAENDTGLVGYQISTPSPVGAHLARLAVHPDAQRQGIGYALVRDLLRHYEAMPMRKVSVNTQDTNQRSLTLYEKAGFRRTKESFPVFQFQIEK
jgi:ribosomal protein S18 acetylase RimI-like enzyme